MKKKVAIHVRVYNERALIEWIKYHIKIGIEHFFIYDDKSMIPVSKILQESNISQNLYTIITTKESQRDIVSPNLEVEDIRNFRLKINKQIFNQINKKIKEYDYLLYIDADEYLVLGNKKLETFLQKYEQYDAIYINWLIFGSNNIKYLPKNTTQILNHFTFSSDVYHKLYKSLTKINKITGIPNNPHSIPIKNKENTIELHSEGKVYTKGDVYIAHLACQDLYTFTKRKFAMAGYARFITHKKDNIMNTIEKNYKHWSFKKFKNYLLATTGKIKKILEMYDINKIKNDDLLI